MKHRTGHFFHEQTIEFEGTPRSKVEFDTQTCAHCSVIVVLNPERKRERGWCSQCDRYTCDPCTLFRANGGPCVPREERMLLCWNNPTLALPFMDSGPNGELLFPIELLDKQRIF